MVAARQHRCPSCGSLTVDRALANTVPEAVSRLLRQRRYSCRDCSRVFWDRPLRTRR
jgi:uncharacterized protein with PIN domain